MEASPEVVDYTIGSNVNGSYFLAYFSDGKSRPLRKPASTAEIQTGWCEGHAGRWRKEHGKPVETIGIKELSQLLLMNDLLVAGEAVQKWFCLSQTKNFWEKC